MYSEILAQLDLSKNEAVLYESLLKLGEASAGTLSTKSNVNRRNVYDSINRLVEKGLIFEVRDGRDIHYQAVDPNKLLEKVEEKRRAIEGILPALQGMYQNASHQDDVYIYRGLEGWKNYLRDILQVGMDVQTIGGKGAWSDPRLAGFLKNFLEQAKAKNISFQILFDQAARESSAILATLKSDHRFLPASASSPAAVDIFGDRIVITTTPKIDTIDEQASFTIIVNKSIADAFRAWFKTLWEISHV